MIKEDGFTLIEMMVALFITSLVSVSFFALFISFQSNFSILTEISDMQNNTRTALFSIVRDLKMAGADPLQTLYSETVSPIKGADENKIHFEMDIKETYGVISGTEESIIYSLYDSGSDGDTDLGKKRDGGRNSAVAENIEKLVFFYFSDNLNILTQPVNSSDIRSVFVVVIGRTQREDKSYKNRKSYVVTLPTGETKEIFKAGGDGYRRSLFSSMVYLKNMER